MTSFDDAGPKRAKVKKAATDEEEEEEPEPEPVAPTEEAKPEGYLVLILSFQLNDLKLKRRGSRSTVSKIINICINSVVPLQNQDSTKKLPTKGSMH